MHSLTALADPTRRQIVELLSRGERAAGEITAKFAMSAPAISQHLKVLREAGLVRVRVEGQRRIYMLDPEGLAQIETWLAQVRRFWSSSLDALEGQLRQGQTDTERSKR